jgi:cytosine/adenosine deaminase-related metal-dependent hydrolase
MGDETPLTLRARVVIPIGCPPLENGAVTIKGNRIVSVEKWRGRSSDSAKVTDLGNVILMPGLVNAHCHLDYTDMSGLFPPPRRFSDWIKLITTEKALWTFSDYAQSWIHGAKMLLKNGTTTVADIEAVPELLPHVWETTPLRIISFLEMTGVKSGRPPELILHDALKKIDSLPIPNGRCTAALSPHAPYSTMPPLLKHAGAETRKRRWPLTMHIAESSTEFEMFTAGRGEMFDWLRKNKRDMSDCGSCSPVKHAAKAGLLGDNLLAVHVNYLAKGDAPLLGRSGTSVIHCPRSRDFFSHQSFPYPALRQAGVNVCLGTDSLATVRKKQRQKVELNLFDEMRSFASSHPDVSSEQIVGMATVNGAKALGLGKKIGILARNAYADLIGVPFDGRLAGSFEAIIQHAGPVKASMIGGQWAIEPND